MKGFGAAAVAAALPGLEHAAFGQEPNVAVVRLALNYPSGQYLFDPVGVYVPKGGKVRWQFPFRGGPGPLMGMTITAFHPANENHELRIPETAKPFNSGPMNKHVGNVVSFEWTFDVEGTYDYFSYPHELVGAVGRIVVGAPGGPAEKFAPGYGGREGRAVVYPAEVAVLGACPSAQIVQKKTVPYPKDLVVRPTPYGR